MKKFFAVLLLLTTLFTPAVAEELDLDGMSLEELLAMQSSIQQAIEKKISGSGEILPEGEYVVGEDIKAGKYIFTVISAKFYDQSNEFSSRCHVKVYSEEDKRIIQDADRLQVGDLVYLNLSDGMKLSVSYGYGTIVTTNEPFGG